MLKINVLTKSPSPHMMDFWQAVYNHEDLELRLFIEKPISSTKSWGKIPECLDVEVADWEKLSFINKVRWIKRISSAPADVWIQGDNHWYWENHLLALLMHRKKVPVVFLAERMYWKDRKFRKDSLRNFLYPTLKKMLTLIFDRNFDVFACMGSWTVEQFSRLFPNKYIFPTQYYVNVDELRQIERSDKTSNDMITLGFCGGLVTGKGLVYIINNLNTINSHNNWQLKIAGDGPLRKELEALVPDGLKSRVEFLGHVQSSEMKAFWESIDVLLFPSLFDGWGMVVVEALASGVPVISGSNVGSSRQYIINGYNGEIRDVDNSFLKPVIPILEKPELLNQLCLNARASVERYCPEIGASDFIKHLKIIANMNRT